MRSLWGWTVGSVPPCPDTTRLTAILSAAANTNTNITTPLQQYRPVQLRDIEKQLESFQGVKLKWKYLHLGRAIWELRKSGAGSAAGEMSRSSQLQVRLEVDINTQKVNKSDIIASGDNFPSHFTSNFFFVSSRLWPLTTEDESSVIESCSPFTFDFIKLLHGFKRKSVNILLSMFGKCWKIYTKSIFPCNRRWCNDWWLWLLLTYY